MIKSTHAVAKGRVQGVGFRYSAVEVATNVGVSGYVKNLQNGDVELVVQGEPHKIESFFRSSSRFDCEFHKKEIKEEEIHNDFRISYNSNS